MLIRSGKQVQIQISPNHFCPQTLQKLSHQFDLPTKLQCLLIYLFNQLKGMNKRKFKEKETFAEAVLNEQIEYPLLYYVDSLYPENLFLLKSNEFRWFIRRVTSHLNALLSLNNTQFFTMFQQNQSVRTCLESCLASFPRRSYGRLSDFRSRKGDLSKIKDQALLQYSYLMKIVLFIFYRISSAKDEGDRELVYNQFLLDIPKLLDIAAIYGESNPTIVQRLIENAYQLQSYYDNDTMDFFNYVQHGKFQELEKNQDTDIDFSPESLNAENYGNRQKYMIEKVLLTLFAVKDILFNLTNFMKYFPKKYTYQLATDYKIQEKLLDGVTFFMNQANNQWNLGDYKERYFALHLEDLRQSIVIYFIQEFKLLKEVISSESKQILEFQEQAHNTYQTFCLLLRSRKKPYHKEYVKIINNLIEESEVNIFFLEGSEVMNAVAKTKQAVDFCQKYERQYRDKHKLAGPIDLDPVLNKNRSNLKKFKEIWISSSEAKRKAIAKEKEEQFKKIEDYQLNAYLNSLKYGSKSKQYDDQPEQGEFAQVILPNEYEKLEKKQQNLSFAMASQKKKYIPKDSISNSNVNFSNGSRNSMNLSFQTSEIKKVNPNLSFAQGTDVSFQGRPNKIMDISFKLAPQEQHPFDLNISKIEENYNIEASQALPSQQYSQFIWNDDQSIEIKEFQEYLQKVKSKHDKSLVNLSFI